MESTCALVYAEQLFQKAYGYPLWFPEHATIQHTARIGDVGYISCGKFHSLFNATLPADDPANNKAPQGFAPLDYDPTSLLHNKEQFLPDGALSSHTVRSVGREGGLGANSPFIPVGGESLFSFKCVSKKGALLLLKGGGATQETLLPNTIFPEYMLDNYESWYKLATERGHRVGTEDLIMVKGTVKATDWDLAAFYDKNDHRSFKIEAKGMASGRAGLSYTKSVISTEHRSLHSLMAAPPDATVQRTQDQCVFLSRYMMRHRPSSWSWSRKSTKARRSSATDSAQVDSGSECGKMEQKVKMRRRGVKKPIKVWDPLPELLEYILKNSNCEVAIASDDDITQLFDLGYEINEHMFKKRLYSFKPRVEVSQRGIGTLAHDNTPITPNPTNHNRETTLTTERTQEFSLSPWGFNERSEKRSPVEAPSMTITACGYRLLKKGWELAQRTMASAGPASSRGGVEKANAQQRGGASMVYV